jgi:hypothetical protein
MNAFTLGRVKVYTLEDLHFSLDSMDVQSIAHGVTRQEPGILTINLIMLIEFLLFN